MSHGLSFVICCHNSAARLPQTLASLGRINYDEDIACEVVVVDNASTDETAEVARKVCPANLRRCLRVVSENRLGLSHARHRGVVEARNDIVSFIDDDNWVCADWVMRVLSIFKQSPLIGAVGGPSNPVFEISPPEWFESVKGFYAVGPQHPATGDITDSHGTLLWGAGLSIRKIAFLKLINHSFNFIMTDRKGANLSTGGDTEICYALRASGWSFWYDDKLSLQHFIPADRLSLNYLYKLMRAMGEAAVIYNLYLIAFELHPFERLAWHRKTWAYQVIKTVNSLIKLQLKQEKGELPSILHHCQQQNNIGHLATLLKLRRQYKTLLQQIIYTSWK
ncbi:MAG: glycosyltransferase [Deltaproteobacteria bacterium]